MSSTPPPPPPNTSWNFAGLVEGTVVGGVAGGFVHSRDYNESFRNGAGCGILGAVFSGTTYTITEIGLSGVMPGAPFITGAAVMSGIIAMGIHKLLQPRATDEPQTYVVVDGDANMMPA